MSKILIYLDNSVIGGYYDEIFAYDTQAFFKRIQNKAFHVFYSDVNETELMLAPEHITDVKSKIPADCLTYVELDEESKKLGRQYIDSGILTWKSLNDAYHIAIASVHRLDLLVSWNFKHIVNYDKIRLFNSVNLKSGYPEIDIRTPQELIHYEE
ncbi:MAG: PIN domain protein [Bacteroidetes bacterium SW_11_45_7]|nr:MAG: PIN domain protein [Bacteroidetes bacterium SW_11_45_7]